MARRGLRAGGLVLLAVFVPRLAAEFRDAEQLQAAQPESELVLSPAVRPAQLVQPVASLRVALMARALRQLEAWSVAALLLRPVAAHPLVYDGPPGFHQAAVGHSRCYGQPHSGSHGCFGTRHLHRCGFESRQIGC